MATSEVSITCTKEVRVSYDTTPYYVLKFKICNLTDHDIDIKVVDNPWKNAQKKLYEDDTGADQKPIKDSGLKKALENAIKRSLKKKGDAPGDCVEVEFIYDFVPRITYNDVFLLKPDGTIDRKAFGGYNVELWDKLRTAMLFPNGPKPQYAFAIPLPYPMAVEREHGGSIEVTLDRLEGLPDAFELVGTIPPLGTPHILELGDRASQGAVVLRQNRPITGVHRVWLHMLVTKPAEFGAWGSLPIGFDLAGESDVTAEDSVGTGTALERLRGDVESLSVRYSILPALLEGVTGVLGTHDFEGIKERIFAQAAAESPNAPDDLYEELVKLADKIGRFDHDPTAYTPKLPWHYQIDISLLISILTEILDILRKLALRTMPRRSGRSLERPNAIEP